MPVIEHAHAAHVEQDRQRVVQEVRRDGFAVLKGFFSIELINGLREAFMPLFQATMEAGVPCNRGPARHYLDVPFAEPFADPHLYENPHLLGIVESLIGKDVLMLHFGTDTPGPGSSDQDVHADLVPLFPEDDIITPPSVVSVNVPLVDIGVENGPLEVLRGSHLMTAAQGLKRLADGCSSFEAVHLERGDVLVRDPRMLHRGTANRTQEPRPVIILSYQRPWLRHVAIEPMAICQALRPLLSERAKRLLRLHLMTTLV